MNSFYNLDVKKKVYFLKNTFLPGIPLVEIFFSNKPFVNVLGKSPLEVISSLQFFQEKLFHFHIIIGNLLNFQNSYPQEMSFLCYFW